MFLRNPLVKASLSVASLLAIILIAATLYFSHWFSSGLTDEGEGVTFVVKEGWSVQTISSQLESNGIISHPSFFSWASRLMGTATDIHAGEYILSSQMSPAAILDKMVHGDVVLHTVTLPEGVTSYQFVESLNEVSGLVGKVDSIPQEGTLLPETYSFTRGTLRSEMLHSIQRDMAALVDKLWDNRPSDTPLKSKEEFITLASIVEKETALDDERPIVAAVFLNRLKIGMPLQADPTVVYGITQGKSSLGRALLISDLQKDTPYNTYTNSGLPIGPIANPGKRSLEAVMTPANVDYLYFVADGSGGHVFASSLAEHTKNHQAWRKIRKNK